MLKTKGREHTGLTGYRETRREYSDCVITDSYRVVEHIGGTEDAEGNCYDWYVIDRHYRTVDRTASIREQQAQDRADIEYIAMETGVDLDTGTEEEEDGRYEAL